MDLGANGEASRATIACHLGQFRAAQATPGREQRERFEHIRLARTVRAHEQVEPRRPIERGRGVIAEILNRNAVERHVKRPLPVD